MKIKLKLASAAILALSSSASAQGTTVGQYSQMGIFKRLGLVDQYVITNKLPQSEDFTVGMSTCLLRIENEPKLNNVPLSIAMLACKAAGLRKRASASKP